MQTQVSGFLQVWAEQMAEGQRGGAGYSMVWGLMGAYGWCNIIQIKCVCVCVCVRVLVQFSSVAQSCPTLCNPMNRSTPGLLVHHQLPEFTQTHVN